MKLFGSLSVAVGMAFAGPAILGCGSSATKSGGDLEQGGAVSEIVSKADPSASRPEILVNVADRAGYDALIAGHKGKVILVDFWATWCSPCVEEFAHTVEISKRANPAELAVIAVSMDEPDDQDVVLKFLQGAGADFDNLISKYGVGQEGFDAFDITDGAIPHYKIYDRSGKVRHTTGSGDEVDRLLSQILEEP